GPPHAAAINDYIRAATRAILRVTFDPERLLRSRKSVLRQPDISESAVTSVLAQFSLRDAALSFIASGDANSAIYQVDPAAARYILKLRCGDFDEIAVTVPAFIRSHGISRVMAPLPTANGEPWIHDHGFDWMLYPFVDGKNGFESPLARPQWIALGEAMRQVH